MKTVPVALHGDGLFSSRRADLGGPGRDWQAGATAFEYPSGEPRADFKKRVVLGLERLEASGARHVLAVLHKGVIGSIVTHLVGAPLPDGLPELGHAVSVSRRPDGSWYLGRRSSNPEALPDSTSL